MYATPNEVRVQTRTNRTWKATGASSVCLLSRLLSLLQYLYRLCFMTFDGPEMVHTSLKPPSSVLPPIRRISETDLDGLTTLVEYLSGLYNPPVYGARRVDRTPFSDPTRRDGRKGADSNELLRADEFERAYAVRWLTGLVSRAAFLEESLAEEPGELEKLNKLVGSAIALLAVCAGTAAARTLKRRFLFFSPVLDKDVEVQLTDVPIALAADEELPTVGTQTWGSACLLAEMLAEDPGRFGLSGEGWAVRVLEIGAGTGLVSLALAKLRSMQLSATPDMQAIIA